MSATEIPGYALGSSELPRSPITPDELVELKAALLWTEEDDAALRQSREVLADQVEEVLDVWYGFVASHPFLVHYFSRRSDGQPDAAYLERVRARFGRWILDTAAADYDQAWLDYADEIGRRHHRSGKNRTDDVDSVEQIPLRYVIAFIFPITATLKPFLAAKGHTPEEVERMHDAWRKAVILQVALWSRPYVRDGDF
jgi:Protoglobin